MYLNEVLSEAWMALIRSISHQIRPLSLPSIVMLRLHEHCRLEGAQAVCHCEVSFVVYHIVQKLVLNPGNTFYSVLCLAFTRYIEQSEFYFL
jgi:hypothetical protein